MKKIFLVVLIATITAMQAQAYSLQAKSYKGISTNTDKDFCEVVVRPYDPSMNSVGSFNIEFWIHGEQAYGFVADSKAVQKLSESNNVKNLMIAGRMLRSGDVALAVTVEDGVLKSFLYEGIDYRSNKPYGVQCVF
jgi:hypothetical protein